MRILLLSDSHGYTNNIIKAVKKAKVVDLIIHLGDFSKDISSVKEYIKDIRCEIVSGNNDWTREYPLEKVLEVHGKKIFITHGHQYNVKYDYQRIINKGKLIKADAVFFGHTHEREELFSDGMLVLNPGSIGIPKDNNKTYCIVEIRDGRFWPRFESVNF
ncbi:MAG: metallophosphoesterase [Bacillota bacterium]